MQYNYIRLHFACILEIIIEANGVSNRRQLLISFLSDLWSPSLDLLQFIAEKCARFQKMGKAIKIKHYKPKPSILYF